MVVPCIWEEIVFAIIIRWYDLLISLPKPNAFYRLGVQLNQSHMNYFIMWYYECVSVPVFPPSDT